MERSFPTAGERKRTVSERNHRKKLDSNSDRDIYAALRVSDIHAVDVLTISLMLRDDPIA
ncbi:hypothetical protein MEX01_17010 [Methylorubrum extorquens]|nr:hypothetical protein MEX01_17010 [Methylorubrum extorquens]